MPSQRLTVHFPGGEDRSYQIVLGVGLKEAFREIRRQAPNGSIFVVTDTNVQRLYGATALHALRGGAGDPRAEMLSVKAGEHSKTRRVKERLEDWLIARNASRDSLLVALGGGMVGDLTGFVAATLFRGVPYVHVPTTLLAQVDSSIGGKVAVNHPLGKNLLGAFHQPSKVYIDVSTLKTLSDREYRSGLAEVIKYGAILDPSLFRFLESHTVRILQRQPSALLRLVRRSCQLKKFVVERDEKEHGLRRILNFGHTIGHALENLSSYRLKHGEAVAIGMASESAISVGMGLLEETQHLRLVRLLHEYGLPTQIPRSLTRGGILQATTHDKKVLSGHIQYTLLENIGRARPGVVVPDALVRKVV